MSASFQTTVRQYQAFGVPGSIYSNAPFSGETFVLNSGTVSNNVYGRAFTVAAGGSIVTPPTAQAGGTTEFAGYLVQPNTGVNYGDGTSPINPSLTLPNGQEVTLCRKGQIIVSLSNGSTVNVGDLIVYNTTTGALQAIAKGASIPVGYAYGYAQVIYFQVTTTNMVAAIEVDYVPAIPS